MSLVDRVATRTRWPWRAKASAASVAAQRIGPLATEPPAAPMARPGAESPTAEPPGAEPPGAESPTAEPPAASPAVPDGLTTPEAAPKRRATRARSPRPAGATPRRTGGRRAAKVSSAAPVETGEATLAPGAADLAPPVELVETPTGADAVEPPAAPGLLEPSAYTGLHEPSAYTGLLEPSAYPELHEPSAYAELAERPAPSGRVHDVRLLLVEDVPQVADRIRELLRSQDTFKLVAVVTDGRKVDDAIAEHRPDVVIVDSLLQGRVKGPAVIERLRRTRNPLPCVAITLSDRPLTPDIEKRVDSVVAFPFGTFDLVRSIRGAVTAGASRNPVLASRIVAVFSAKGGVGKTTIALNLAVALQGMGLRTALVDGSLQFGDVRRMLGVADDVPSIIDLPTDAVRSSDLAELLMPGPAGVDVLLAPPRLEQAELLSTRDLDKILDMLRRTYHAVVIDTPSSLGEMTLALLDAADVVIQVVTPETAALDITRLASQAFVGIGYPPEKLQLLLNRADTQGSLGRGQIRQACGRDPDHTIASDWALVAHSNALGVPFVTADPEAAVSGDLRAVAAGVAAIVGAEPEAPLAARRRRARA